VFLASHYVELRRQAAGGMQPNLNLGLVKRIYIPLPPLDEQSQIVCAVSERLSQMEYSEESIEANLKRSSHLRQSILMRAFEGSLVSQDPSDEPASVLLKRIGALFSGNGKTKRTAKH
jgi:type I restriction enzyme, S subunit